MVEIMKCITEEMDLIIAEKSKAEDHCWACGPAEDSQKLGDARFMITATYLDKDQNPDFEYLEICPKHFAFLMKLGLSHIMRVEKGKEAGPLNLTLLQTTGAFRDRTD